MRQVLHGTPYRRANIGMADTPCAEKEKMIRMTRLAALSACSKNAGPLTAFYPFLLGRDTGAQSSAIASIENLIKFGNPEPELRPLNIRVTLTL